MLQISQLPNGALKLGGALDIYAAEELRSKLLEALDSSTPLSIDLSGVDACDITAFQLLCAARKSASECGRPFEIVAISKAFDEARSALGLSAETFPVNLHH